MRIEDSSSTTGLPLTMTGSLVITDSVGSAPSGPVSLLPDAKAYQTTDTISILLSNQSSRTIAFADHLTYCTIMALQCHVIHPAGSRN